MAPERAVISEERAREYRAVVNDEIRRGKDYLMAMWQAGHTFRAYSDRPEAIGAVIGRSPHWVTDRMRLAGDYTKPELAMLIDKHEIQSKAGLWLIAYGTRINSNFTVSSRRGLHLPLTLIREADTVHLDIVAELKDFFATIRLSELRAILSKHAAEREAERGNTEAA